MKDYSDFLSDKTHAGADHGFEPMFIPDALFDFQKHLVARAAAAVAVVAWAAAAKAARAAANRPDILRAQADIVRKYFPTAPEVRI